ncbi:type II toxin-antitoxin system RelE family toxin [Cupriavidus oxalaticus]|uniref:Type II toxin-antitoxin system RelE/ParE family toxin n=1 Tax=Cupriavidus oxalaticus TaxID=96344 RepID=A0A4P7LQX8_9BURK|nr:type II toxin-antitoxin system RelE/ParE family toxin [Cupriavidus oxalaticus]QBY56053.1 type II toxin-antitoxin system RelE/ParE family toxin [Cupriavidus oxalaticus]
MLTLNLTNDAVKFVNGLPPKQYTQVMRKVIDLLRNPRPNDSIQLKGATDGERRTDIGEYRIIYRHDEGALYIDVIGKRNDGAVYR